MVFINGILSIIVVWFLHYQISFAAPSPVPKKASNNVIITKIKSNFIDVARASEIVYFYGNVVFERQDISILADKMLIYYDGNSSNQANRSNKSNNKDSLFNSRAIKKIEAEDNVKIFNEEFVANGKSGVYDPKQNNFILKGDVVLNKGSSVAKGQKFIYNLKTKKSYLVGRKDENKDNENGQKKINNTNQNQDNRVIVIIDDSNLEDHKSNKE